MLANKVSASCSTEYATFLPPNFRYPDLVSALQTQIHGVTEQYISLSFEGEKYPYKKIKV